VTEIKHRANVGSVVLGLLNGLKHTPQTLGPVLGIEPEKLERIIQGREPLTKEVEEALITIPGINQRDFYPAESQHLFPIKDDTNGGVVICRREDTNKSLRVIYRGPNIPYYIYADMAMSNLSSFRPEWIKQLYVNDGEDADSLPDWAFNKGHFEHQFTYFIGQVNFHWKDRNGKKHVRQMNSGDANYIVPFVPHSFTTREENRGFILAVTYGGATSEKYFQSQISSLDVKEYLTTFCRILTSISLTKDNGGVEIFEYEYYEFGSKKKDPGFRFLMAFIPILALFAKMAVIELEKVAILKSGAERWGYNLGNSEVMVIFNEQRLFLKPGDSFLIQSTIAPAFVQKEKGLGSILIVEISPYKGNPYTELALIEKYAGEEGLKRVHTETTRWY